MKRNLSMVGLLLLLTVTAASKNKKTYSLQSPDGKITAGIELAEKITWYIHYGGQLVLAPSFISMTLNNGEMIGRNVEVLKVAESKVDRSFVTPLYKKQGVDDHYNELTITCKGNYGLVVRAYNDGIAYRFFISRKDEQVVVNEEAFFNFDQDYKTLVPYVRDFRGTEQYVQSFEALYTPQQLSGLYIDTLGFLPVLVEENNVKLVILEADLDDYPGMFVTGNEQRGFSGKFAPYPLEFFQGGYKKLNTMISKRAPYIARVQGTRKFPWRAVVIAGTDTALLNNDMVQKLATPSQIPDPGWIKPGKVAWDWWNDWNISHVNFKAGINTATYQYYIDFAAANHLEYIIMDEGWSDDFDLLQLSPDIDLNAIVDYGRKKNVGVILWATWYAVHKNMEAVFGKYAAMGVKGFKIDFMDRDDQVMVASLYDMAKAAAAHQLVLDYHGMYKPTGLQRTWPNVLNFEGVKGMENNKWTPADDVPGYDVTIPYIRMLAGPMDYTPGAMRNATKDAFRPINSMPESQGTRCHQLAMYIVFEAPLQMLADNPTAYMKEQESTDFISAVPTIFDSTVALDGKLGEYLVLARKNNNTWFAAAMTNWEARDISIDLSFLGPGKFNAIVFSDGLNADRDATDYQKSALQVSQTDHLTLHLAPGGGAAIRIEPSGK